MPPTVILIRHGQTLHNVAQDIEDLEQMSGDAQMGKLDIHPYLTQPSVPAKYTKCVRFQKNYTNKFKRVGHLFTSSMHM